VLLDEVATMVRLITHNLLACHVKNCTQTKGFPLAFNDIRVETREAEFNSEFLKSFFERKVDWDALVNAAKQLGDTSLPVERPEMVDDDFLKLLHHVLLEIHVEEGEMICPNCKHVYKIRDGIPNMLLAEHEIG